MDPKTDWGYFATLANGRSKQANDKRHPTERNGFWWPGGCCVDDLERRACKKSTSSVDFAITNFFIGTVDCFFAEDDVPEKLHDTATPGIVLLSVKDPLSELNVVVQGSSEDLGAGYSELGATGCTYLGWYKELFLLVVAGGHPKGRGGLVEWGCGGVFKDLLEDIVRDVFVI